MEHPVSVVIPVAPDDTAWTDLLPQLDLASGSEVILAVGSSAPKPDVQEKPGISIFVCREGSGRAGQMNAGACMANHRHLWFLHADSRLTEHTLEALDRIIPLEEQALYYFDLKFLDDGPKAMKFNEWAVRFRSDLLKIPFGDQGFLISRHLFFELGGYREDVAYGEDHILVWKTRQEGYPVRRIAAGLSTSARKYKTGGWAAVTARHVWLTFAQAVPQWLVLLRRRITR